MKCNFQLLALCLLFLYLRSSSDLCGQPQIAVTPGEFPFSVRFAPACLKLAGCEVAASSRCSHLRPNRSFLTVWLLLLADDIESNPGPPNWKFPCGVCSAPVKSNQRGVQCDVCGLWLHARCIGVSIDDYRELQRSNDPWCCNRCLREAFPFSNISCSDSIFNSSTADSIFNTSTSSQDSSFNTSPSHQFSVL